MEKFVDNDQIISALKFFTLTSSKSIAISRGYQDHRTAQLLSHPVLYGLMPHTKDQRTKSPVYDYKTGCYSTSYRYARCHLCTTMHNCAQLIHAKLTHDHIYWIFALSTRSRRMRLPTMTAARWMVSRETPVFSGSRRRLSCERLVFMRLAIAVLVRAFTFISC